VAQPRRPGQVALRQADVDSINLLQWPAMAVTLAAAWLIASSSAARRNSGFWVFLLSNGLWIVWAAHAGAPALIALQVGLASLNIRGAIKTDRANRQSADQPAVKLPASEGSGP